MNRNEWIVRPQELVLPGIGYGNRRSHLICFPSLKNHFPVLPVQYLKAVASFTLASLLLSRKCKCKSGCLLYHGQEWKFRRYWFWSEFLLFGFYFISFDQVPSSSFHLYSFPHVRVHNWYSRYFRDRSTAFDLTCDARLSFFFFSISLSKSC